MKLFHSIRGNVIGSPVELQGSYIGLDGGDGL